VWVLEAAHMAGLVGVDVDVVLALRDGVVVPVASPVKVVTVVGVVSLVEGLSLVEVVSPVEVERLVEVEPRMEVALSEVLKVRH